MKIETWILSRQSSGAPTYSGLASAGGGGGAPGFGNESSHPVQRSDGGMYVVSTAGCARG